MSEALRELLDRGAKQREKDKKKAVREGTRQKTAGEFLLDMARDAEKHGFSGPSDFAVNHDKYIYGDPHS